MIGFKTIDDYSFDECLEYLTGHDNKDTSWNEINQRYQRLLAKLQKDDENEFQKCSSANDFKRYLALFGNLSGATKYQPLHEKEAMDYLKNNPVRNPTPKRGFLSSFTTDARRRNPLTNVVLYFLLFASLIATMLQIPGVIRTVDYILNDSWTFIHSYGKGFMPGFLLSASVLIGISKIVNWKRSGMAIMIISIIIILAPTICNEFLEFICFSVPSILGMALLWGILKLKKNGNSTWGLCKKSPRGLYYFQNVVLSIWLFMITILPAIAGLWVGFRGNLYSNGMRCLDAYFNDSPYYSYDLYQRILIGNDYAEDVYERDNTANDWLLNAKWLSDRTTSSYEHYSDEFSDEAIFINTLIFKMKYKGHQEAMDYVNSEKNKIDQSKVFKYLYGQNHIMGYYEYISPYKDQVSSLLNESDIYDIVDVEVVDDSVAADSVAYYDDVPVAE